MGAYQLSRAKGTARIASRGGIFEMSEFAKGPVVVLGPEDGESFWQPLPSVGYIVNKLTPYNTPYDSFSLGIQVLEPGAAYPPPRA
jgi:hypothetical protein